MNTKNKMITMLIVGVIGFSLLQGGNVYAADMMYAEGQNTFVTKLVDKISSTFGLDKAKVQAVVEAVHTENRAEREKEMQAKQEERLSTLVSEGKITESQKAAIIAKHAEMKSKMTQENMEKVKNMTQEQRQAYMTAQKAEIDAWAKEQGIDPQYFMMRGKFKGGDRHGMMR